MNHRTVQLFRALPLAAMLALPQPVAPAQIVVGGGCSLGDAITAANSDATIGGCSAGAGADVIRLTADVTLTAIDNGVNGLPEITSKVRLEGHGFTLERDPGAPDFRLLWVAAAGSLQIEDLTLTGGSLNYPDDGGAVANRGELTLVNTRVVDNHVGGSGGGIANTRDGLTTLINTTVSGNSSSGNGGGIYSDFDSPVVIVGSNISDNSAAVFGDGGGIFSYAGVVISNSTISGNSAASRGGGIGTLYAYAFLIGNEMTDSVVSHNFATTSGGGVYSGVGSSEVMVNVTISGNESGFRGGGLYNASYGAASLTHTTLSGNNAPSGAGIYDQGGVVTLNNSIVANSLGEDCFGASIVDGGGNFDSDGTCPGANAITGLDPMLADNGGLTATHALLPGSSAIDSGGDCGLLIDQRGFGRIAPCDSGAYEFEGSPAVGASVGGITHQRVSCSNLTLGQSIDISGQESWNCRQQGLAIDSGNQVRQQVRGTLVEPAFAGSVEGIHLGGVRCRNLSSGQEIRFQLDGATSWDCRARGLIASKRDRVSWIVAGIAD